LSILRPWPNSAAGDDSKRQTTVKIHSALRGTKYKIGDWSLIQISQETDCRFDASHEASYRNILPELADRKTVRHWLSNIDCMESIVERFLDQIVILNSSAFEKNGWTQGVREPQEWASIVV
jgi:hypothetical protein